MSDLYKTLGVSRRASRKRIQRAFRGLAKRSHPDVNAGDRGAEQRFKDLTHAYETLSDPQARALYDHDRRRRRAQARLRFWRAAATGAATFLLTVGLVPLVLLVWQGPPPARVGIDAPTSVAEAPVTHPPAPTQPAETPSAQAAPHDPPAAKPDKDRKPPEETPPVASAAAEPPRAEPASVPPPPPESRPQPAPEQAFPEALAWARLADSGDLLALIGFIDRYSETLEADRARRRLAELIASSDDVPALLALVDRFGSGPLGEIAAQRVRLLQASAARGYLPPRVGAPTRWTTYRNARFGFALDYPDDVFAGAVPKHDGVRVFVSRDGRAILRISSAANKAATITAYRRALMQERYRGAVYDYTPQRRFWFVLSGTLGEEMFYERITFACDKRSVHGWQLVYPLTERALYDPIIEEVHRSYKHGNGPGARCAKPRREAVAPSD